MSLARQLAGWDLTVAAARRRIPAFAMDYLLGGCGADHCAEANRRSIESIHLHPRYSRSVATSQKGISLFGSSYDQPFGIAPIGMGDLIWPGAAEMLATAALQHRIPFVLSSYALTSMERIREIAGDSAWFQLYSPVDAELRDRLLKRVRAAGYRVLVVTVDVPAMSYRPREVRHGISVPLSLAPRTVVHAVTRPHWALRMLARGMPTFANLDDLAPPALGAVARAKFLGTIIDGQVTAGHVAELRRAWPHALVVKGVLGAVDALRYVEAGADGIIVSNHGGRQLDAAPTAEAMLPAIRDAVRPTLPVMADGGVRSGLDIARLLSAGADMVFAGRAPYLAVAAAGERGGDHLLKVFAEDLALTMRQLGCPDIGSLPQFRAPEDIPASGSR